MGRVTRLPRRDAETDRTLVEVEAIAWLLDNSIPIPGTGGRRIGLDALIGFIPAVGDLVGAGIGLYVIVRAAMLGLPRIVIARMVANSAIDLAIGAIPLIGDAFDLWFKANTRNLRLMRRYLESPDASTKGEWLALALLVVAVLVVAGVMLWLVIAAIGAVAGVLGF